MSLANARVTSEGARNVTETFRPLSVVHWTDERNKRRKKLEDNDKFDNNRNEENQFNEI